MPKGQAPRVFTLEGTGWSPQNTELDDFLKGSQTTKSCVIFLRVEDFLHTPDLAACLQHRFGAPQVLWSDLCTRHNGFFGHDQDHDDQGTLVGLRTWFRFQFKFVRQLSIGFPLSYDWHSFTFFTRWTSPNTHDILCFHIEPDLECEIIQTLNSRSFERDASSSMLHSYLTSVVVKHFDASVWSLRDCIRRIEQNRMKEVRSPETNYPLLHELARHACHSSETASVAINTLSQMSLHLKTLQIDSRGNCAAHTFQDVDFHTSLMHGIHARSVACEKRLSNETNLAINLVAQEESRATVSISQATQSDSAAMKVVAVVTLLFLPSTFVSTIFSMTFFSYDPGPHGETQAWQVSNMIWLYFVFTVPLTVVAVCSWVWWQRKFSRQAERRFRHIAPVATTQQLSLPR